MTEIVWLGAVAPTGYGDCNDVRPTVYPGAEEVCDAQFNNCDDPLNPVNPDTSGTYRGVVGDCFCPSTDCQIDGDGDGNSDCVDSSGLSCTPTDDTGDGFADDCSESTVALVILGQDYFSVEADCYCPEETCGYDWNGDITSRCYTSTGSACTQPLDVDNHYLNCASDPRWSGGYVFTHDFVDSMVIQSQNHLMKSIMMATTTLSAKPLMLLLGVRLVVLYRCSVETIVMMWMRESIQLRQSTATVNSMIVKMWLMIRYWLLLDETDDDGDGWVECELTSGFHGRLPPRIHRVMVRIIQMGLVAIAMVHVMMATVCVQTIVVLSVFRLFRPVLRLVGMGIVTIQIHGSSQVHLICVMVSTTIVSMVISLW